MGLILINHYCSISNGIRQWQAILKHASRISKYNSHLKIDIISHRKFFVPFSIGEVSVYPMFLIIHRMKTDLSLKEHYVIGNPINQNIVAVYGKYNCILLKII